MVDRGRDRLGLCAEGGACGQCGGETDGPFVEGGEAVGDGLGDQSRADVVVKKITVFFGEGGDAGKVGGLGTGLGEDVLDGIHVLLVEEGGVLYLRILHHFASLTEVGVAHDGCWQR